MYGIAISAGLQVANTLFGMSGRKAANKAQNEAIMAYNRGVLQSTIDSVEQINLQRAMEARKTSATLFNIQAQNKSAKEQTKMLNVDNQSITRDAVKTVTMQGDRAVAGVKQQHADTMEGMNLMLRKTVSQANNSLRGGVGYQETGLGEIVGTAVKAGVDLYTSGFFDTSTAAEAVSAVPDTDTTPNWFGKDYKKLSFGTDYKVSNRAW